MGTFIICVHRLSGVNVGKFIFWGHYEVKVIKTHLGEETLPPFKKGTKVNLEDKTFSKTLFTYLTILLIFISSCLTKNIGVS